MMLVQKIIYCLSRLLKDVNCDLCKLYQIVCRDWSQIIIIIIIIIILIIITIMINSKLKNEEGEGLVIIYSLVDREFWRIKRFLSGGQRGISLPRQSMTAEDYRELNVSEPEMRAEG